MAWSDLYTWARTRHHGAFAFRDAPAVGLTSRAVDARSCRESWPRPHPAVVVIPGIEWSHLVALAAAQLHLGDRAAAGGMSAAWLYGLVARPPARPHLLLPHAAHPATRGVAIRRSRHVADGDRTRVQQISTLTVPFLMTSLAAQMSTDALRALAIDARQRRLLDIADVAVRIETMPRIPGRRRLVQVLRELEVDGSDSVFEHRVRQQLHDAGFLPSAEPVPVRLPSGRTVHLDIGFVAERVAIECQGFLAHSDRRQLTRDALRENAIALSGEWLILKLTWDRFMHEWPAFLSELRTVLRARRPGVGA